MHVAIIKTIKTRWSPHNKHTHTHISRSELMSCTASPIKSPTVDQLVTSWEMLFSNYLLFFRNLIIVYMFLCLLYRCTLEPHKKRVSSVQSDNPRQRVFWVMGLDRRWNENYTQSSSWNTRSDKQIGPIMQQQLPQTGSDKENRLSPQSPLYHHAGLHLFSTCVLSDCWT